MEDCFDLFVNHIAGKHCTCMEKTELLQPCHVNHFVFYPLSRTINIWAWCIDSWLWIVVLCIYI